MKTDFEKFAIGTVFNGVRLTREPLLAAHSIQIKYPSRLEAMALDPAKIADNHNLIYQAGQIDFCVALYKTITVYIDSESPEISISASSARHPLIRHAALLMKQALGIPDGLHIDVADAVNLRHCGLGSSSGLIAGVAAAINELYGKPLAPLDLVRYCAQNHGEEIDGDDAHLMPVQCIGGSGVCGNFEGGLIILAGQATPICQLPLPDDLTVVIGIPEDYSHPDAQVLMDAEVTNMAGFRDAGQQYGPTIAYRLIHDVLPALTERDLKPCKELIFDYRWDMGSIQNCSFVYPRMVEIAQSLRDYRDDEDIAIISLSSVGPGFFALTRDPAKVEERFKQLGLSTHVTAIHNGTYHIEALERIA